MRSRGRCHPRPGSEIHSSWASNVSAFHAGHYHRALGVSKTGREVPIQGAGAFSNRCDQNEPLQRKVHAGYEIRCTTAPRAPGQSRERRFPHGSRGRHAASSPTHAAHLFRDWLGFGARCDLHIKHFFGWCVVSKERQKSPGVGTPAAQRQVLSAPCAPAGARTLCDGFVSAPIGTSSRHSGSPGSLH